MSIVARSVSTVCDFAKFVVSPQHFEKVDDVRSRFKLVYYTTEIAAEFGFAHPAIDAIAKVMKVAKKAFEIVDLLILTPRDINATFGYDQTRTWGGFALKVNEFASEYFANLETFLQVTAEHILNKPTAVLEWAEGVSGLTLLSSMGVDLVTKSTEFHQIAPQFVLEDSSKRIHLEMLSKGYEIAARVAYVAIGVLATASFLNLAPAALPITYVYLGLSNVMFGLFSKYVKHYANEAKKPGETFKQFNLTSSVLETRANLEIAYLEQCIAQRRYEMQPQDQGVSAALAHKQKRLESSVQNWVEAITNELRLKFKLSPDQLVQSAEQIGSYFNTSIPQGLKIDYQLNRGSKLTIN